jgi:hypothetical protein
MPPSHEYGTAARSLTVMVGNSAEAICVKPADRPVNLGIANRQFRKRVLEIFCHEIKRLSLECITITIRERFGHPQIT